ALVWYRSQTQTR
ncbi:acrB/AcrD/AcrF family protein, partial [Vibrio parahaemolyticus VPTS-2010_2]